MRFVIVAAAALNQTPLDWAHNRNNIISAIKQAQKLGAQLLCCPELAITGYGCEDTFLSINTCTMALESLYEIVPHTRGICVALGLPLLFRDGLYNTVAVVSDGQILGFVAKQHLAGSGVHYEARWFKPWPGGLTSEVHLNGQKYPLGDLMFDLNEVRIGFEICEDAWAATRRGVSLATRGVDIILNPSASHFAFGKNEIRKRFVLEGARAFGVVYLYANLLGNEAGRIVYDGDTIIAAYDTFLAMGPRFSFSDYVVTAAEVDIQTLRMQRASTLSYPKVSDDTEGIIQCPRLQRKTVAKSSLAREPFENRGWEASSHVKEEEFARVISLGLFDYLRKTKAFGFVLNLSGGVDSSTTACLVYLMLHLAMGELGEVEFRRKLQHIILPKNNDVLMQELLFCLYQKSENNSTVTEEAATQLSFALKASFASLSIEPIIKAYCKLIEPIINRPLSWQQDDIALQNIQARVRSPSAWLLANLRNAILLCSSNRSEAATGYCTMDGDTAGGLSPIAGVDKTFLQHWLMWLEKVGIEGIGPIPALNAVNNQTPTAELRPKNFTQTDETDLMPYEWLDAIDRLFVLEKRAPLAILKIMQQKFPDINQTLLATNVERFINRFCVNQWKRERLAPSFHLDDESLDPKTWCRFPIINSGYEEELEKMWRYVKG